jgi:hypothetical protein
MKADDATVRDELTVKFETTLNPRHAVHNMYKTQAGMLASEERSVETGNINIDWNQNSCHEQSKTDVKRTAAAVKSKGDAKQNKGDEGRRCRETKKEEQGGDTSAYRNPNEARSLDLLGFRIHGDVCMTPKLSDLARETTSHVRMRLDRLRELQCGGTTSGACGLDRGREGRVRCSAWLAGVIVSTIESRRINGLCPSALGDVPGHELRKSLIGDLTQRPKAVELDTLDCIAVTVIPVSHIVGWTA